MTMTGDRRGDDPPTFITKPSSSWFPRRRADLGRCLQFEAERGRWTVLGLRLCAPPSARQRPPVLVIPPCLACSHQGCGAHSRLGRQNNTIDFSFGGTDLLWGTDVSASIGRRYILDRFLRHPQPGAIHFHLVVVIDHSGLGRTTIRQIAARHIRVLTNELRIEALVPCLVSNSMMSVLPKRNAWNEKNRNHEEQNGKIFVWSLTTI